MSIDTERLRFLERALVNCQELARLMDQKAGFLLAAVGILTAALGAICRDALTKPSNSWMQCVAVICALIYMLIAFIDILLAVQVFTARSHEVEETHSPGMLFPLIILKRHSHSEKAYKSAADDLTAELMAEEYANQVLEISRIYEVKQKRVNLCVRLFTALALFWLLSIGWTVLSGAIT